MRFFFFFSALYLFSGAGVSFYIRYYETIMVKMMRHQSCNVTLTRLTAETNSRRGLEGGIKVEEKRKNKENVKLAVDVGALRRLQDAAEHSGR